MLTLVDPGRPRVLSIPIALLAMKDVEDQDESLHIVGTEEDADIADAKPEEIDFSPEFLDVARGQRVNCGANAGTRLRVESTERLPGPTGQLNRPLSQLSLGSPAKARFRLARPARSLRRERRVPQRSKVRRLPEPAAAFPVVDQLARLRRSAILGGAMRPQPAPRPAGWRFEASARGRTCR